MVVTAGGQRHGTERREGERGETIGSAIGKGHVVLLGGLARFGASMTAPRSPWARSIFGSWGKPPPRMREQTPTPGTRRRTTSTKPARTATRDCTGLACDVDASSRLFMSSSPSMPLLEGLRNIERAIADEQC
ncbi:MAG TPA: hypothetical protein VM869_08330, partial [Enhygromyxa sp.]|nr:hypothetical protein [Enhygromyxa sp.]